MKFFGNLLALLTALAIIILVAWGIFEGSKLALQQYQQLDSQTAVLLLFTGMAALTCTLILALSIRGAIRQHASQLQPDKAATYQRFTELWFHKDKPFPAELHAGMAIWGSESVLKAYQSLVKLQRSQENDASTLSSAGNKVLIAIRKDLGASSIGIDINSLRNC